MRITRQRRAQLARQAARIRADAQRAETPTPLIADEITRRLPTITPLEAWRLAYGWSRPEVLDGIAALYRRDGLAAPALTTSMLCRWEHGVAHPSAEYSHALSWLYGAPLGRLGLRCAPGDGAGWLVRSAHC